MEYISKILIAIVALEHIYILILEMFLWTKPRTNKIFGITPEDAQTSKALAANQGLYNGFLAAGLVWSLFHPTLAYAIQIQFFFLICIILASLLGSLTAKKSILIVQGLPATLALLSIVIL